MRRQCPGPPECGAELVGSFRLSFTDGDTEAMRKKRPDLRVLGRTGAGTQTLGHQFGSHKERKTLGTEDMLPFPYQPAGESSRAPCKIPDVQPVSKLSSAPSSVRVRLALDRHGG